MSDQYLYHEGGSSFHDGHGGQIIHDTGAEIAGTPLSEAENESAYFTDFSNVPGQIPFFGDESSFILNDSGHLFDIPYAEIPCSKPEYAPIFSMDFSVSGLNPRLEGNPTFTENFGDPSYDVGAAATPNLEEYGETRHSTDLSNYDQNYLFGGSLSFPGGADEQFSNAFGAEIFENAAYNANAPPYSDMMPQSAFGLQIGFNWQDAPQSGDNYNTGPPDSDQPNASPSQPRKHGCTHSGGDYNIGPSDPGQPNESPSQPQKVRKWTEEDETKLLMWRENGVCYEKIGEWLCRTASGCQAHRHILLGKAWAPKDVPILCMKDISRVSGETTDQKGIDRVDLATPGLKDKSLVDWNTPGLKDWVHDQLEAIRKVQNGGRWMDAWNTVADQLNKKSETNLEGKDLVANFPYR